MTANGQPDNPRASRYILKDFMNGKLLYPHAPPGIKHPEYHTWPERKKAYSTNRTVTPREARAVNSCSTTAIKIDKDFFSNVYAKGAVGKSTGIPANMRMEGVASSKPWKDENKHKNKKKKEKLRRVYAHLDQH